MMQSRLLIVSGLLCLALNACDNTGGSAPGAVSQGEAQALEEAAEMLDAKRLPPQAVPDLVPSLEDNAGQGNLPEIADDKAE